MNLLSLIEAKRDGRKLAPGDLGRFVAALPGLPDYQVAAFLMAVFFRGLDPEERTALTLAMRDSGDVLSFPPDPRPLVDKHSTGGVGDKVSLPLAPLLACLGLRVPMISGRGLGITGGTLDKLESIPGFTTSLSVDRIRDIVQTVGCVICGQTDRMVPADKRLYALRDVTGTVPSIPLITASILSKKLAESLDALVLDVKFGCAAFMANRESARELARAMVALGNRCGTRTIAVLTDMNTPVGRAAGNWLEVRESVACLAGQGPEDLRELVLVFAAHLLEQTGLAESHAAARRRAETCLASGAPLRKWEEMLAAQGANLAALGDRLARDSTAPAVADIPAPDGGYVSRCDARLLGEVIRELGGGRLTQDTVIQPDVGVDRLVKPGERVERGAPLGRVHARDAAAAAAAVERLRAAFAISAAPPPPAPLVVEVLAAD